MKSKINLLLGAALALLVTLGTTSLTQAQAVDDRILFNSLTIPGSPAQVYVIDGDGNNLVQLTNGKSSAAGASWHPSHQYISFLRDDYLWIMQAAPEGKSVRPFAVGPASKIPADFSPDGNRIAYIDNSRCLVIKSVDFARKKVSSPTLVYSGDCFAPSWSPNGEEIAFSSNDNGNRQPQITVISLATQSIRSLDAIAGVIPRYSADGAWIVFCGFVGTGLSELFMTSADFSQLTQLTSLGAQVLWPSFSPGGEGVVFSSNVTGATDLHMLDLLTGDVTLFQVEASAPHWAP